MAYSPEISNGDRRATIGTPMLDEIVGHIRDALARDGLGLTRTIEMIEHRAAGATGGQLLRAAILVLREQQERNAALTAKIGELGDEVARLEDDLGDLEAQLDGLRAKPAHRAPGQARTLKGRAP
jgi:hypothetical protein